MIEIAKIHSLKCWSDRRELFGTFGTGAPVTPLRSPAGWRDLIDQLLFEGLLVEQPNDGRPLITLASVESARALYRGERKVLMRVAPQAHDAVVPSTGSRRRRGGADLSIAEQDRPLFEALRAWRRAEAAGQGLPPYVIFHDQTLADIARARPMGRTALAAIGGVGQGKLDRYGEAVLAIVATPTSLREAGIGLSSPENRLGDAHIFRLCR